MATQLWSHDTFHTNLTSSDSSFSEVLSVGMMLHGITIMEGLGKFEKKRDHKELLVYTGLFPYIYFSSRNYIDSLYLSLYSEL